MLQDLHKHTFQFILSILLCDAVTTTSTKRYVRVGIERIGIAHPFESCWIKSVWIEEIFFTPVHHENIKSHASSTCYSFTQHFCIFRRNTPYHRYGRIQAKRFLENQIHVTKIVKEIVK
uniref:Putative secreted protein n=1 Tax=Anopheles darlingi TaxID=43151 RepID=A0A2M4DIV8_ANODA